MAIAAPARRSDLQTAPRPAGTEPPEPRKRPRDRPRPGGQGRSSATASVATPAPPKRKSGVTKTRKSGATKTRKAGASSGSGSGSGRKGTPGGKGPSGGKGRVARAAAAAAPARTAPARRKVAPRRRPAGVIPIAAGTAVRGAVAVSQLPESGLIHRLTRGRVWIGVLGMLLVGIVALNVVTLSFAASAGKVDQRNQELSRENTTLQSRAAGVLGEKKIIDRAKKLGLGASTAVNPKMLVAQKGDVATAAARLSAAAAGTAADPEGSSEGEEAATAAGEATGSEEAAATGEESEYTLEEEEIYAGELAEWEAEQGVIAEESSYEEPVYEETVTE